MKYHLIAFLTGFILDQIIGDPMDFPHPIRLIGSLISLLERRLNSGAGHFTSGAGHFTSGVKCTSEVAEQAENPLNSRFRSGVKCTPGEKFRNGVLLCAAVLAATVTVTGIILFTAYRIHPFAGVAVEAVRVIAPLIYTFLGGPVAGFAYKAVNTMDSMVGYHNERYEYFGRAAAKLDDVVNFLPARISALLMVLAAFLLGGASGAVNGQRREYSASDALRIFLRDRYNHKSPNSAQTESACAGALQVRLSGDAYYFGELVRKPYIGDDIRPIETEDIKRACRLMMTTAYLGAAICVAAGCFVL